jgi:hypothetical protein
LFSNLITSLPSQYSFLFAFYNPISLHTQALLEGQKKSRFLDVSWSVASRSLELVSPNSHTPISTVDFGTTFFSKTGEVKIPVLLVNRSNERASYSVSFLHSSSKIDAKGKRLKPTSHRNKPAIYIIPSQGMIEPQDGTMLQVVFKPGPYSNTLRFQNQRSLVEAVQKYANSVKIASVDLGASCSFPVAAQAVNPDVKISRMNLDFGDCPVNCHQSIVITLSSCCNDLPMDFAFKRVANFRIKPRKGVLKPMQTREVQITFQPNSFGKFKTNLGLSIAKGANSYVLKLKGRSEFSAPKSARTFTGTATVNTDFKKEVETKFS